MRRSFNKQERQAIKRMVDRAVRAGLDGSDRRGFHRNLDNPQVSMPGAWIPQATFTAGRRRTVLYGDRL